MSTNKSLYLTIADIVTGKTKVQSNASYANRLTAISSIVNIYINNHLGIKFNVYEDAFSLFENIVLIVNMYDTTITEVRSMNRAITPSDTKIIRRLTKCVEASVIDIINNEQFTKENDQLQISIYDELHL